jgi:hypothetical protein
MALRLATSAVLREKAIFEEYSGENHMSVLPVALNRAAQIAFRRPG